MTDNFDFLLDICEGKALCLSCIHRPYGDEFDRWYYCEFFEENDKRFKIEHWHKDDCIITQCPHYVCDKALYYAYLKTERWKKIARKRIEKDNYNCTICGTAKNLQVHHITYENLFHENLYDLVTVCKGCHAEIHKHDIEGSEQ